MPSQKATDAIVDLDDAIRWVTVLLQERPEKVVERILDCEPFVLGLAMDSANRLVASLRRRKIPEPVLEQIRNQVILASAYTAELMRQGYRQLWDDVIDPVNISSTTTPHKKGNENG